ncbi:MAG: hypothetical protein K2X27_00490, partial [Candidatus Obscuribacterales bacterium]|nr:hypothetical protein [Candidatus Obscuribacterales bacterium]
MPEALERTKIIEHAMSWMRKRGWHRLLAKRSHFEQSLLEHSLIELDTLLELLPTLSSSSHYGLTQQEQEILCVSVLVHDTGKETAAWQEFIQGKGERVGHINLDLTLSVIPEVCSALNLNVTTETVGEIMARIAEFHHNKPGRSDGDIFSAMLTNTTERFQCLAHIVKGIDHFCSASSSADAIATLKIDPALGNHLSVCLHKTNMRGISTILLHAAAREAFMDKGWKPCLYFKDSTVYYSPAETSLPVPTLPEIEQCLKVNIARLLSKDVVGLIIGSPQANILPKPDLVNFDESRSYLTHAASRIGTQSFAKKPLDKRRDVVEKYWKFVGKTGTPSEEELRSESMSISVAQPEMIVLKAFKALINLCCTTP